MGDAINRPGHHVVFFYQWADSGHTRLYIFQATDRRPYPSTTGLDLRYTSYYLSSYTPIRYFFISDSSAPDTSSEDTLQKVALPIELFRGKISFTKPEGVTDFYVRLISINGSVVYKMLYKTSVDSSVVELSPEISTGIYFLRLDDGEEVISEKIIMYLK